MSDNFCYRKVKRLENVWEAIVKRPILLSPFRKIVNLKEQKYFRIFGALIIFSGTIYVLSSTQQEKNKRVYHRETIAFKVNHYWLNIHPSYHD